VDTATINGLKPRMQWTKYILVPRDSVMPTKKSKLKAMDNVVLVVNPVLVPTKAQQQSAAAAKRPIPPTPTMAPLVELKPPQNLVPNVILHLRCSLKELNEQNIDFTDPLQYNPQAPPEIKTFSDSTLFTPFQADEPKNAYTNIMCSQCQKSQGGSTFAATPMDCSTERDDINKKIQSLKFQLYKKGVVDKKSACFWCTYEYDTPTCYIPRHEDQGVVEGYGSFCRPECAAAFLMDETMDDSTKFERYHLLNRVYGSILGKNIQPAPNPHYTLDKFYGTLSINEYRQLLKTNHLLMVVDKPMSRLMPELHQDSEDIAQYDNGGVLAHSSYKVKKRTSGGGTKRG